jgi:two-component system copper resistance phosphate regulon response regulator CusR
MKLLLVEDDPSISQALREGLEESGYRVQVCRDGERGLQMAMTGQFRVIVLDRLLPSLEGAEICRRLREARVTTPILMLTALGTVSDRVRGLEIGADDYLTKPFEFAELLARIRALERRDRVHKTAIVRIADLEIDTAAKRARRGGEDLRLTPREYSLLEVLAVNEGRIIARDTIQQRVWMNEESSDNNVSAHMRSLRRKVDAGREPTLIHTVVGLGYLLRVEAP